MTELTLSGTVTFIVGRQALRKWRDLHSSSHGQSLSFQIKQLIDPHDGSEDAKFYILQMSMCAMVLKSYVELQDERLGEPLLCVYG